MSIAVGVTAAVGTTIITCGSTGVLGSGDSGAGAAIAFCTAAAVVAPAGGPALTLVQAAQTHSRTPNAATIRVGANGRSFHFSFMLTILHTFHQSNNLFSANFYPSTAIEFVKLCFGFQKEFTG
jgi:hypothetical protein